MVEIKTVHVIVFPFFTGTGPNPDRLKRWKKNLETLAKDKNAAVFIVNEWSLPGESMDAIEFYDWVKKRFENRCIAFSSVETQASIAKKLAENGISFSEKVDSFAYGQHAGGCVPKASGHLIQSIEKATGKKFNLTELTALSEKSDWHFSKYAQDIIRNVRPDLYLSGNTLESIKHAIEDRSWHFAKSALRRAIDERDLLFLLEHPHILVHSKKIGRQKRAIKRIQLR